MIVEGVRRRICVIGKIGRYVFFEGVQDFFERNWCGRENENFWKVRDVDCGIGKIF